jgi:Ca-activated chloride channel family protein
VALAPSPWSQQRQILHIGIQGFDVPRPSAAAEPGVPDRHLGLDVRPDRLPLAQQSLNL